MEKKYWKGLEELRGDAEFVEAQHNEFAEPLPVEEIFTNAVSENPGTTRRDFLKFLGFGITAASLAACEAPVKKTIPYLVRPEEIVPGVANWYASTFSDANDYCSILVKTREGRPVKIEGNTLSNITKGGTSARVQASVLSLYDSTRLAQPLNNGKSATWEEVDKAIIEKLNAAAAKNAKIRILSTTLLSPSARKVITEFATKYSSAKHITYDAVSYSSIIASHNESFGKAVLPSYRFDNANVIVSFGADFLANWISPVEHIKQYIQNRKVGKDKKTMSKHFQFESCLSLSGSNADVRVPIKPSQEGSALLNLYNIIAGTTGAAKVNAGTVPFQDKIANAAEYLLKNKGKALVISGTNDTNIQLVVNAINSLLDSYGNTIDVDNYSNLKQGNDAEFTALIEEMKKGEVDVLILYGVNPLYTYPRVADFKAGLDKVALKISFADRDDETTSSGGFFVCPDHHYLEAWNDAEPRKGSFSLGQPTIAPLFKTRAAQESLLKWSGVETDYHTYIQEYWKANIFPQQKKYTSFEALWNNSLHDGVFELDPQPAQNYKSSKDISGIAAELSKAMPASDFEIVVYQKTPIGDGSQAGNPWLQEMPDPVSKNTWDNYLTISLKDANKLSLKNWQVSNGGINGDMVGLNGGGIDIKSIPVIIQPGQAEGTVGLAIGYGRTKCGKAGVNIGVNAYPLIGTKTVSISKNGQEHEFAATQTHHTLMGRDEIARQTTLADYIKNPASGNAPILIVKGYEKKTTAEVNLWDNHETPNHLWGMSIDLSSCIGCGSCVIGCQAENNVPVVGKTEVRRSREMHWIRIDRYYSSEMTEEAAKEKNVGKVDMLHEMEQPAANPTVVFQPIMCQHCNHAPCETVCPVNATNHSSEGMNQMAYNRCVGTRYCANNCPYKVRRFNWFKYANNERFDYNMNDDLGKMVLNPDVVVRARGVMEKCSLCVQRIQEGKLAAKKEKRKIKDEEIKTACASACPADAIVFGDWNNKESKIVTSKDERSYYLLEEINVQPNIMYKTRVWNRNTNA